MLAGYGSIYSPQSPFFYHAPLELSTGLVIIGFGYVGLVLASLKRTPEIKLLFKHEIKTRVNPSRFIAVIACIFVSISVYYLLYSDFKLKLLYKSYLEIFEQWGVLIFFAQLIYFTGEMFIMVFLISYIQGIATEKGKVAPYGGFFLALTWGASHFIIGSSLTGNVLTVFDRKLWDVGSLSNTTIGIYYIMISLLMGVIFNLLNKDFRYAFPMAVLLYLL
jgi:hypothetical protein